MGNSYFVPRNVKGESRILYIFSMKSLIYTIVFGIIGLFVWMLISNLLGIDNIVQTLICVAAFGVVGYLLATLKVPDIPMMGPFRKAGGEYLSDIIIRFFTFQFRKKVYMYNYEDRKEFLNIEKKDTDKDKKGVKI